MAVTGTGTRVLSVCVTAGTCARSFCCAAGAACVVWPRNWRGSRGGAGAAAPAKGAGVGHGPYWLQQLEGHRAPPAAEVQQWWLGARRAARQLSGRQPQQELEQLTNYTQQAVNVNNKPVPGPSKLFIQRC